MSTAITPQQFVIVQQADPPGPSVRLLLGAGSVKYVGEGGWARKPRPRRVGYTEWEGYLPAHLEVPLFLDGLETDRSVEPECSILLSFLRIPQGPRREPPAVRVIGAGSNPSALWVLESLDEGDVVRRESGERIRVQFTATFYEFVTPDIVIYHRPKPAAAAVGAGAPPPARTYTVKKGDTLSEIAAKFLGNWRRWPEIANLNGVRDPRKLPIGKVLRIP